MKKSTTITSDLLCVEGIFSQVRCAQDLAVQICGVADIFLSAVKEAVPGLQFKVKDGPSESVSLFLEIVVTEQK